MTNCELLRWLVETLSRDVRHCRMMNASRSTVRHCILGIVRAKNLDRILNSYIITTFCFLVSETLTTFRWNPFNFILNGCIAVVMWECTVLAHHVCRRTRSRSATWSGRMRSSSSTRSFAATVSTTPPSTWTSWASTSVWAATTDQSRSSATRPTSNDTGNDETQSPVLQCTCTGVVWHAV